MTLDGLLMSDGSVSRAKGSRAYHYGQTCSEPTFLAWAAAQLPCAPPVVRGPYSASGYFKIRSHVHEDFAKARRRWYDEHGRKRLPADFEISPEAILAAYLGDGCLSDRSPTLCTCAFDRADLNRLVEQFDAAGIRAALNSSRGYTVIRISAHSSADFLDYIGPSPLPAYARKWALRTLVTRPCSGCGCDLDERTSGCAACRSRQWARRQLVAA